MHPILFEFQLPFSLPIIGSVIKIYTYGFLAAIGFLSAFAISVTRAGYYGIDKEKLGDIIFYSSIMGIIGARATYVIINWKDFSENILEIFKIYNGGIVFYGGALAGIVFGVIMARFQKINILRGLDTIAPAFAAGHMFGRIGCHMFGCCFGKVAGNELNPLNVCYPAGSPAFEKQVQTGLIPMNYGHSLPVIPTQLMEAFFLCILTIFLLILERKKKLKSGTLFAIYLGLYSIFRFSIEFFRDYDAQFFFFNCITVSQAISIALLTVSVIILIMNRKNKAGRI